MRNLKRALSLALASVMLLGMMVTGAGAASFPDVEETHNVEAIEVLQAVDVMIGDENGNFGPDDPVNRAQMAVIMAKLLKLNYNYYEGADPGFWDVPSWAAPYVAACYANGIVSGYGDGQYGSGDGVTATQAASMMMRALGYFQHTEDYKDGFELVTVRQGSEIGIFDGVGSQAGKGLTRNEVARMALNALESEMVTFTGTPGVTVGDVTVGYRAEYTPRTSTELKYTAIENRTSDVAGGNNLNRGQYYIQLGEELYNGKLTKKFDRDDFMRPSINWKFDGKNIGTYVDYDLLVDGGSFTDEVKYSALYDLLTYTTIRDNELDRYEDGMDKNESKDKFSRSNNAKVGGLGVLTEVFFDQSRNEITITSINTYLAKANSDYNKNTETLSLKVYDGVSGTTYTVDSDEVAEVVDAEKGDFMLVYLSGKNNATRKEVVNVFDVEILSDSVVTKFSTDDKKVVSKLTTNGTEYKTNPMAFYDKSDDVLGLYNNQQLTDTSYNLYMDRYGNLIGVDLYEGTKNYVFITGFDRGTSHISTKTADAAAIFLDGTMDTITVNVTETDKNIDRMNGNTNDGGASGNPYFTQWQVTSAGRVAENRWYTYTVASNGIYTLRPVENMFASDYEQGKILNTANLYVDDNGAWTGLNKPGAWAVNGSDSANAAKRIDGTRGRAYGEDASIYITVEAGKVDMSNSGAKDAITEVKGVYSGIQDVKMEIAQPKANEDEIPNRVYTVYDGDRYIIASIVVGEAQGAAANFAYILSGVKSERYESGNSGRASDGVYYWEFDAFYQGEKTTLTAKTKYPSGSYDLNKYTIQELRLDGEYVTDVKVVPPEKTHTNNTTNVKIEDMDVYDVGRVAGTYWENDNDPYEHLINTGSEKNPVYDDNLAGNGGASASRLSGTIYLQGRTLYVGTGSSNKDVGLALAKDAKALLVQGENYAGVETRAYNSVDEAVSNIADYNTIASGTQFRGRIAAVLDGHGAAQWVVIISDTELVTGNRPSYGKDDLLVWDKTDESWTLKIPAGEYENNTGDSTTIIYNWLVKAGCSNVNKTRNGWDFTFKGVVYKDQKVEIKWVEDTDVAVSSVTVTPAAPEKVTVGNKRTFTVSVDGVAGNPVTVSFDEVGTKTATLNVTAPSGKFFDANKNYNSNGWTATVNSKTSLTLSCTVEVVKESIPTPGEVKQEITDGHTEIAVEAGTEYTFTLTGAQASKWYYVSLDGIAKRGVQKASADGELTFTYTPSSNKVDLYTATTTTVKVPSDGKMGLMYYKDENGDENLKGVNLISVSSFVFNLFARARAAATEIYTLEFDGKVLYYTIDPKTMNIQMFKNDLMELLDAAAEAGEDGFTDEELTMGDDENSDQTIKEFDITTKENAENKVEEIEFVVGAPKAPGVELVPEMTKDGMMATIEWYEVDANGNTVPTSDTVADATKTYVPKVIVLPDPSADETKKKELATEVTVTATVVDSEGKLEAQEPVKVEGIDPDKGIVVVPGEKPVPVESAGAGKVFLTVNAPEGYTVKVGTDSYVGRMKVEQNKDLTLTISSNEIRGEKITVTGAEAVKDSKTQFTLKTTDKDVTVTIDNSEKAKGPFTLTVNQKGEAKVSTIQAQGDVDTGLVFYKAAGSNPEIHEIKDSSLTVSNTVEGDVVRKTNNVYAGETVTIECNAGGGSGAGRTVEDGTYSVDGVTVKVASNKITFTMPEKNFGLVVSENGVASLSGEAAAEVMTITAHDGVVATWTSAKTGKDGKISGDAPVSVPVDARLTITSNGTGTAVLAAAEGGDKWVQITSDTANPEGIYNANATNEKGRTFYADPSEDPDAASPVEDTEGGEEVVTDLYSVRKVVLNEGAKSVDGVIGKSTVVVTTKANAQGAVSPAAETKKNAAFVSVDEAVTFTAGSATASEKYTAFTTSEIASEKLADNKLAAGGADTTVYGAFKVVVGSGVNVKAGDKAISGTNYIVPTGTRKLTGAVAGTAGTNVVATITGTEAFTSKSATMDAALKSGQAIDKDYTLTAVTKLTLTDANARTGTGANTNILGTTGKDTVVYVKKDTKLFLVSANESDLTVTVGTAESTTVKNGGEFTVGNTAATIVGGASTANIEIEQIIFVQDEASWKKLPENVRIAWDGATTATNRGSWESVNAQPKANFPWIAFKVNRGAGMTEEALKFNSVNVTTPDGVKEVKTGSNNVNWDLTTGKASGWYAFEMTNDGNQNVDHIEITDKDLKEGSYTVSVNWAATASSGSAQITGNFVKSTDKTVVNLGAEKAPSADEIKKFKHGTVLVAGSAQSSANGYAGAHLFIVFEAEKNATVEVGIEDSTGKEVFWESTAEKTRAESNAKFFWISLMGGNSNEGNKRGPWVSQDAGNSEGKTGEPATAGTYTYTLKVGDEVTTGTFELTKEMLELNFTSGSTTE